MTAAPCGEAVSIPEAADRQAAPRTWGKADFQPGQPNDALSHDFMRRHAKCARLCTKRARKCAICARFSTNGARFFTLARILAIFLIEQNRALRVQNRAQIVRLRAGCVQNRAPIG
jgi:hypothetical protein